MLIEIDDALLEEHQELMLEGIFNKTNLPDKRESERRTEEYLVSRKILDITVAAYYKREQS